MTTSGHVTSRPGADNKKLWYARYKDPQTGQWRVEAPEGRSTKKNALDLLRKRQREIEDGVYSRKTDVGFSAFADEWLERHGVILKPATFSSYKSILKNHLKPHFKSIPLKRINPKMCQDYVKKKTDEGYSPATVSRIVTILKKMMEDAVEWEDLVKNPARKTNRPPQSKTETQILNEGQIQKLLGALPDEYRPLYETAILTGMRQGELLALRWANVNFEEGFIHVNKTWHDQFGEGKPKSEASTRDVDMPTELGKILSEHKAHSAYIRDGEEVPYNRDGDLVFYTMSNEKHDRWKPVHLRRQNLLRRVHRPTFDKLRKADKDFPYIRFHDIRHCYGSLMAVLTGDIAYVSQQMGHSRVSTTHDLYAHPIRRKGVEKLGKALYPPEEEGKVVPISRGKK